MRQHEKSRQPGHQVGGRLIYLFWLGAFAQPRWREGIVAGAIGDSVMLYSIEIQIKFFDAAATVLFAALQNFAHFEIQTIGFC